MANGDSHQPTETSSICKSGRTVFGRAYISLAHQCSVGNRGFATALDDLQAEMIQLLGEEPSEFILAG
jgi:hypothetical protein